MIAQASEPLGVDNFETFFTRLEPRLRKQFLEDVAIAIDAIEARMDNAVEISATSAGDIKTENDDIRQEVELQNANSWRNLAWLNLANGDPPGSMHKARCGAEAVAKHLYRFLGLEHNGRPAKTMRLEDLLKAIEKFDAPDVLKRCLNALQILGNFGSHDQDDEFKYLNKNIAEAVLRLYDEVLSIYRTWLRDKKSVSGS